MDNHNFFNQVQIVLIKVFKDKSQIINILQLLLQNLVKLNVKENTMTDNSYILFITADPNRDYDNPHTP